MASKREALIERVTTLGETLGSTPAVEGISNKDLEQLVEQLEKEVAAKAAATPAGDAGDPTQPPVIPPAGTTAGDAGDPTQPPVIPPDGPLGGVQLPTAKAVPLRAQDLQVAPGRSLVCARGVLGPGTPMREGDCSAESLATLYQHGELVRTADVKKAAAAESTDGAPGPEGDDGAAGASGG